MDNLAAKLIIVVIGVSLVFYFLNKLLRTYFKLGKQNYFTNNYVNDMHKKLDWIVRIILVSGFILFAIPMYSDETGTDTLLVLVLSYMFFNSIVLELVRVTMQKKYAENENEYIPTLIELGLIIVMAPIIIYTKFFGWFS
ncbi:DUF4181 domain-containing protein [Sporosarcina gallistercoris]|uniref:DUF4181 domain-containing protein n=1 Tax=Sporosarcina gallistercoris TaxID=2762245 RepID=UPI003D27082D